jgi:uncharacterized protein (DUF2062 family)
MRLQWLSKRFPTAQSLKNNRFLKPFSRHLHHHFLWQFNRRAVAGGVAVGLFFGILVPFAQIFLAVFAAISLRVNLPVAAFSTLISNPLTFPPIYYLAYRLGNILTGSTRPPPDAHIDADIKEVVAIQQGEVSGWLPNLADWLQTIGMPLATGLIVLAVSSACVGYFAVNTLWKIRSRRRWRRRQQRHHRVREC